MPLPGFGAEPQAPTRQHVFKQATRQPGMGWRSGKGRLQGNGNGLRHKKCKME